MPQYPAERLRAGAQFFVHTAAAGRFALQRTQSIRGKSRYKRFQRGYISRRLKESTGLRRFLRHEALHGVYALLDCPWMNPPQADERASHKALQLRVASELGMRVPDTLMTSDPGAGLAFIERHGIGGTIHKIFAATHQVWRETRLVRVEDVALLESVRLAPVIFQERIPAVADVRVTVVGDDVFPMAIDTRHTGYDVDFGVNMERAPTSALALPEDVVDFLHRLMAELGIVYGAADFRLTPEGEYVFLEINPAREFLFVEQGAGHPITDAVAGWLAEPLGPVL